MSEVVWLAVRPVRPLGGGVHVGPEPGAGVVSVVATLHRTHIKRCGIADCCGFIIQKTQDKDKAYICCCSQPERGIFSYVSDLQKSSFQPIVQA